jgi:glycosyltransferase involved in cell wall biosynthesis
MVEAAAAGLPVVSTPVGVANELVSGGNANGDCGGAVVRGDPAAFGRVIAELAVDRRVREHMGAVGRRRAQAYSWDRVAETVAEVYTEILTKNRRRSS